MYEGRAVDIIKSGKNLHCVLASAECISFSPALNKCQEICHETPDIYHAPSQSPQLLVNIIVLMKEREDKGLLLSAEKL